MRRGGPGAPLGSLTAALGSAMTAPGWAWPRGSRRCHGNAGRETRRTLRERLRASNPPVSAPSLPFGQSPPPALPRLARQPAVLRGGRCHLACGSCVGGRAELPGKQPHGGGGNLCTQRGRPSRRGPARSRECSAGRESSGRADRRAAIQRRCERRVASWARSPGWHMAAEPGGTPKAWQTVGGRRGGREGGVPCQFWRKLGSGCALVGLTFM